MESNNYYSLLVCKSELIEHYLPSLIFAGEVEINELTAYEGLLGQDIYENLRPEKVVSSRISKGGTGFDRVKEELDKWRSTLISLNQ